MNLIFRLRAGLRRRAGSRAAPGLLALGLACLTACSPNDDRSATWEYISPALFQPNCATVSCHSRAAAVAGLDFSDGTRGYTSLTGLVVAVDDPTGASPPAINPRPLLTPFVPAQSRVVNMLRARDTTRMPPDRPLSEADIRLVEKWILNGAARSAGMGAIGGSGGSGGRDAGSLTDGGAINDGSLRDGGAANDGSLRDGGAANDGSGTSDGARDATAQDASAQDASAQDGNAQ